MSLFPGFSPPNCPIDPNDRPRSPVCLPSHACLPKTCIHPLSPLSSSEITTFLSSPFSLSLPLLSLFFHTLSLLTVLFFPPVVCDHLDWSADISTRPSHTSVNGSAATKPVQSDRLLDLTRPSRRETSTTILSINVSRPAPRPERLIRPRHRWKPSTWHLPIR